MGIRWSVGCDRRRAAAPRRGPRHRPGEDEARSPTDALPRCGSGRARSRCPASRRPAAAACSPRAARPAAASGWRQTPGPACRGCRARGDYAPRGWPCAALRRRCARPRGSGAAPASPAGRAPAKRQPPFAFTRRGRSGRERNPPERLGPEDQRRHRQRIGADVTIERAHGLRQAWIVPRTRSSRSTPRCARTGGPPCWCAAAPVAPSRGWRA